MTFRKRATLPGESDAGEITADLSSFASELHRGEKWQETPRVKRLKNSLALFRIIQAACARWQICTSFF